MWGSRKFTTWKCKSGNCNLWVYRQCASGSLVWLIALFKCILTYFKLIGFCHRLSGNILTWTCMKYVEGFDIAELEKKITALEQRFLETTMIGVRDPKSEVIDLLSQLRHRTNSIVHRIVTRPNLRSPHSLFPVQTQPVVITSRHRCNRGRRVGEDHS